MGAKILYITLAFFGLMLLLGGTSPGGGFVLLALAARVWYTNPTDNACLGWLFILALVGVIFGVAGPEYAGSLQH